MLKNVVLIALVLFTATYAAAQDHFIRVIKAGDAYKFEIPDHTLGAAVLFGSRIVGISSPAAKVYAAGQMRRPPVMIQFTKRDKLIVIERLNNFVDVDQDDPIFESLTKNMQVGGVYYFNIEGRNDADDASIIDVTSFFSDRISLVWPLPDNVRKGRLDSKLSELLFMKEMDDRVNIRSHYEFIDDLEAFSITVQYFLLSLPKEPLMGRFNDERIGFQSHNRKAYSSGKQIMTNRYITRWRIEPASKDLEKHAAGEIVEPQNPIVLYIEPYFPPEWIPYIKQGVEVWNVAFEKIGFNNVLIAKEFPADDPDFDPYDIKTNVIRYIPLDEANAAGEIWTDPRSGEIISGEVLWWNDVVNLLKMWRFTQTAAVDPRAKALEYDGDMMGEMIRYAMTHEVGHVLGLQHNLRSSYAYPVDSLRSATFSQQYGTAASIMDYARYNHVAQPGDYEKGMKLTPPDLGPFDLLSVEYGYSYIHNVEKPEDELPALSAIFKARSGDPMYLFAPFTVSPVSPDPAALSGSLGDDGVQSALLGIKNTRIILDSLTQWTIKAGGSISDLRTRYDALSRQYFRFVSMPVSYIGGLYGYYDPLGNDSPRFLPVDKDKQKEALAFVINALSNSARYLDQAQFSSLIGSQTDQVLTRQSEIMESLLGNFVLPRLLRNASFSTNAYTLEEYLSDLDRSVWTTFSPNSIYDKSLQIQYLQTLKKLSLKPRDGDSFASASQAVIAEAAFSQLIHTKKSLESIKHNSPQSKVHQRFLLNIIDEL